MKKILSIVATVATLFAIASCNCKPSAEAVEAAAVKNATDLVTAVAENNTDNIKAALAADATAYAKLGISDEKTPDLVKLYNDTYENTLEDNGIEKADILDYLKAKGIEIPAPETKAKAAKGGENEETPEVNPDDTVAIDIDENLDAVVEDAEEAAKDLGEELKDATKDAAGKAIEAIGDYSAKLENEAEVEEAPIVVNYFAAEEKPTFNGGDANAFPKWIQSQLSYPESARAREAQGRVVISFRIGTDGQVKNAVVTKGVDPELDAEALRVVKSSPAWTPGKQDGKPVEVSYVCPVVFKIQ